MSCPYATLLGKRGEGVHSTRIAGLALNDILATVVAAAATSYFFKVGFMYSLLGWFIAAQVLHILFGVDTAFLEMIGIKPCNTAVQVLTVVFVLMLFAYI